MLYRVPRVSPGVRVRVTSAAPLSTGAFKFDHPSGHIGGGKKNECSCVGNRRAQAGGPYGRRGPGREPHTAGRRGWERGGPSRRASMPRGRARGRRGPQRVCAASTRDDSRSGNIRSTPRLPDLQTSTIGTVARATAWTLVQGWTATGCRAQ